MPKRQTDIHADNKHVECRSRRSPGHTIAASKRPLRLLILLVRAFYTNAQEIL